MSEEDAAAINLLPKGEYDAVVKTAVEKVSKASGNDMIELDLTVYGSQGEQKLVRDWLVSTDGGQAKLQRFCKSADLWETYQAGEICADSLRDASVRVKVVIEEGKDGFQAKNKIADYLPRKLPVNPQTELRGVSPSQRNAGLAATPPGPPNPDDIPF